MHWKITRLLAFEDTIDIRGRAPIWIAGFRPVVDQAADFRVVTIRIDGRETVASSQRCDLLAMDVQEGIRHRDKTTVRLAGLCGDDGFELGDIVSRGHDHLHSEGLSGDFQGI